VAVYAIGDVQGCYTELQALLERIDFDPARDRLWFAGDLVNRGPRSLETLRFVRGLGDAALTVLGNHDLHLIAADHDPRYARPQDTLQPILNAPDRDELLAWLRRQPLLHHDAELGFTLIHAGLPPQWDLATAQRCAAEVEAVLRNGHHGEFLSRMYGNEPDLWSEDLAGWDRLRFITNCFTRLRYIDPDGRLNLRDKGAPGSQAAGHLPWFKVPGRASAGLRILFGHWSTLGRVTDEGVFPLDSGCLWGGELTALRLEDRRRFSLPCQGARRPGEA
jgi:bis(5'-nucleosyl)-tetraphosphatase (symmetrical)